jgi:hypothetical protein
VCGVQRVWIDACVEVVSRVLHELFFVMRWMSCYVCVYKLKKEVCADRAVVTHACSAHTECVGVLQVMSLCLCIT